MDTYPGGEGSDGSGPNYADMYAGAMKIPPRPTDPKELALWKWLYFIPHYGRKR